MLSRCMARPRAAGLAVALCGAARAAWSCPACAPAETTRDAYLAATVLLSSLPLLVVAGVGVWVLRVRARRPAAGDAAALGSAAAQDAEPGAGLDAASGSRDQETSGAR